ncbi:MAG: PD-(D/E)XK nuclease family protein [Candidatus Shikimatogenerans sp. JK-2022]|nr:PD-(D/E)XK nuclease family protein [Candidatus Shikimatogenerans bostrichidophilus]
MKVNNLVKKKIKNYKKYNVSFTLINYYIHNSLYFFYYLLNIDNYKYINGLIIHKVLNNLYKKYININLNLKILKKIKKNLNYYLKKEFIYFFKKYFFVDKELILKYKILKQFLINFINCDKKLLLNGNKIKIIYLEKKIKKIIKINKKDKINIKGVIDRIDLLNNNYRIIEYKSFINYKKNNLFFNKKKLFLIFKKKIYNNILQLLIYSLLLYNNKIKYIYNTLYLPSNINNIKNLKINNNTLISNNLINKIKFLIRKIVNYILNKKFIYCKLYI